MRPRQSTFFYFPSVRLIPPYFYRLQAAGVLLSSIVGFALLHVPINGTLPLQLLANDQDGKHEHTSTSTMRRRNAEDGGGPGQGGAVDSSNGGRFGGPAPNNAGMTCNHPPHYPPHSSTTNANGRYDRPALVLGGAVDRRGEKATATARTRRRRRKRSSKQKGCCCCNGACVGLPRDKAVAVGSVAVFLGTLALIGMYHRRHRHHHHDWNGAGGREKNSNSFLPGTGLRGGGGSRKRPRNYLQVQSSNEGAVSALLATDADQTYNPHNFRPNTPQAPPCTASLDPTSIAYTLVTQMSSERIWMLGKHCQRWGYDHPISVAVFTNRTRSNVTGDALATGCTRRQLSLSVLNSDEYDEDDYPVNKLRNMALSQVRTSHVMYVDIDFWPSTTLRPILESPYLRQEFGHDPRLAVVVPAYQLYAHRLCGERENCKEKEQTNDVPSTMDDLRPLLDSEDVGVFDLESNWNGHGSTSYKTFLLQNDGELFDLPCINSNRYEPYLAFRYCSDLPPFQEAFTGYGKNKMTWAMHLRRSGYDFAQVGGAFVCHYPHFRSKAKLSWDYIPNLNVSDVLAVSVEARKAAKQNRFNVVEKKDMIRGVDWTQTKRGKGDLLYLDYRKWLYETVTDEARLKMCDETYTDDNKLWVN